MQKCLNTSILFVLMVIACSCNGNYRFLVNPIPNASIVIGPGGAVSGQVWISGDWFWNGSTYSWRDGYWGAPHPNQHWRPGSWKKRNNGWYWSPGRWVR